MPRTGLLRPVLLAVLGVVAVLAAGCATPDTPAKRFSEILQRYPSTEEALSIKKLAAAAGADSALHGKTITVIVHPAYSLFFREEHRSTYTEAKYDLLKFQLDNEARFISEIAKTGNTLIVILPGDFETKSIAPLSYIYYLNAVAGSGASVYYLPSETWTSGSLSLDSMITLFGFVQRVGSGRMLIGGGYIGRCQREFYNQVSAYLDKVSVYVVPEISSISPDDISDRESAEILSSIRLGNYTPVMEFIDKKTQGAANILRLPAAPGL